jgi:2-polyprenyl-3-methyl-5-hydroxy-6-metoxy-1,4-benzoquinol methylase
MPTIGGVIGRFQRERAEVFERARAFVLEASLAPVLKEECERQRSMNERPIEFRYALNAIVASGAESILDVGPGITAWPALLANCGYQVTAVDQIESYWRRQIFRNRHWKIEEHDITTPFRGPSFDAVTCISTLEHIPNHRDAVRVMLSALNPRGVLVITVPWNEKRYYHNAYDLPEAGYGRGAAYITQIYSPAELEQWLQDSRAELVDQEFYKAFTGALWTVGERIRPPVKVQRGEQHQLTCMTLRQRERT